VPIEFAGQSVIQSFIKRAIRHFGFDLRRYNATNAQPAQLKLMLDSRKVNLIFDVGANSGQFGRLLRTSGYRGRIVSFEPLHAARQQLLMVSHGDTSWEIGPRAALGSEHGEVTMHVAANAASSSILRMLPTHSTAAPESRYVGKEVVAIRRLDSLAADLIRPESIPFLKIDTQGYEDRVLEGAGAILDQIVGLQLEMSLVPLYEDQKLFNEMHGVVQAMGFSLWAIWPSFVEPVSGRLLQVDATYFRA